MILTAHQPVYLPWLGLFHKIAIADMFCSFDEVQYLKKDWNNRNRIKTANGVIWLTVPVKTKDYRNKSIKDIEIDGDHWQKKHWQSILWAYKKAPYFHLYADFFEDLYKNRWHYLADLNEYILLNLLEFLSIKAEWTKASCYHFEGIKSELVLGMCKRLKADTYIFGELGKSYADVDAFNKEGIVVEFQKYIHPTYPQLHGKFVSHLSVIDLMFNVKDPLEIIMKGKKDESISSDCPS